MIKALGPLVVNQPGLPQAVSSLDTAGIGKCHGILIQALPTNVGRIYIGEAGLVRSTFVGVLATLAIPTANIVQSFSAALTLAPASIQLKDFYIDADTQGDGVVVTLLIA